MGLSREYRHYWADLIHHLDLRPPGLKGGQHDPETVAELDALARLTEDRLLFEEYAGAREHLEDDPESPEAIEAGWMLDRIEIELVWRRHGPEVPAYRLDQLSRRGDKLTWAGPVLRREQVVSVVGWYRPEGGPVIDRPEKMALKPRRCAGCLEMFVPDRPNQRHHNTSACRVAAHRRRQRLAGAGR